MTEYGEDMAECDRIELEAQIEELKHELWVMKNRDILFIETLIAINILVKEVSKAIKATEELEK